MNNVNRKYSILFVDDEPRITNALKAIFRKEYSVYTANSGVEALTLLDIEKVDVIVSDQRMPEMLGSELLAKVSSLYPQTMCILLTGFMDQKAIVDSINEAEVYRFINKPWNNEQIQQVVAEAAFASEFINIESQQKGDLKSPESATKANRHANKTMIMIEEQNDVYNQIDDFCSQQNIMIHSMQHGEQTIAATASLASIGVAIIELTKDTTEAMQTINLLKQTRPELIAIAITQKYDGQTAVDLINQGQVFKYLAKPLQLDKFKNIIEDAFDRHYFLKNNHQTTKRFKVEAAQSV